MIHRFSVVLCLLLSSPLSVVFAQGTVSAVTFPSAVASGGNTGTVGYPYAVLVNIQGWTAGANQQAYIKIYNSTNNEYMWSATGVWSNGTTYASSNQPVVPLDAGGNWKGWIYAKHNDAAGATVSVRTRIVGTTTQITSSSKALSVLNLATSGNGGWLVRTSSPAANKAIAAYAAGGVVGSYRTEDNGVTEGYSYSSGGFKIAVPVGYVDSLVAFNDDGTRNQVFVGPWYVSAGQETDAGSSGSVTGKGTATLSPSPIGGGVSQSLTHTLRGEIGSTITDLRIVIPASWTWSHDTTDVSVVAGVSGALSLSGDTIAFAGLTIGGTDSIAVRVNGITPPDTTITAVIRTLTGVSPDSIYSLQVQPTVFVYSIPRPINVVKQNDVNGVPLRNGQLVTVRGVVTVANEFASPTYLQDLTGGIAVYDPAFSATLGRGDEVIVSGLIQPFNGLMELVNTQYTKVLSQGNLVEPLVTTALAVSSDGAGGVEQYEGLLVRLNGVTVTGSGSWANDTNYPIADATGTSELRIDKDTNLGGAPIPGSSFDIVGVVGQFIGTSPYIGGYQILPRSTADIISSGPIFVTAPSESLITPTSLTIVWETLNNGSTHIRYGTTPQFELGSAGDDTLRTNHAVTINGLSPATVYYIGAYSHAGVDTSFATALIASTASPVQSTGAIRVFFNKSVNPAVAAGDTALGNQDLVMRIVTRINAAQHSIDAALYSLSSTPGDEIAQALISARSRGVTVRVICEHDNRNSTGFTTLASDGVPLIDDAFDAINAGAGLMHNKFFVFDAQAGAPESTWVWTGSWNPTFEGTSNDYQNSIEIQDQALARAYTIEFNEMWGSSTAFPNASLSRFGARKQDNTPHRFTIGGVPVESYFSPSDRTTSHIVSVINGARSSVNFATLTFTRNDLGSAVVGRKSAGCATRGIMDNNTDQGNEYAYLLANGVDVLLKQGSGLLHHKYAVIDGDQPAGQPITVTGSHNWSSSAETANNENTLIVHDARVANLYLQEFAARYFQFGGKDSTLISSVPGAGVVPDHFALEQNYPNPFNPVTTIEYTIEGTRGQGLGASNVRLVVYDILGREVAVLVNEKKMPGMYEAKFDGAGLSSGVYFYRLNAGRFTEVRKMLLIR